MPPLRTWLNPGLDNTGGFAFWTVHGIGSCSHAFHACTWSDGLEFLRGAEGDKAAIMRLMVMVTGFSIAWLEWVPCLAFRQMDENGPAARRH